jgi:hypothetical protein
MRGILADINVEAHQDALISIWIDCSIDKLLASAPTRP